MASDLAVDGLTVEYSSGGYVARPIDEMNLLVPSGQLVLLRGASGCGKTTLLSVLAGILTPAAGAVRFGDVHVTALRGPALTEYRRHTVGVVFQAFNLVPSLTASENVQAPLRAAGVRGGVARRRAEALLEEVGLGDRMRHRPGSLSGGQQQRVAIARALAHDPPLVLADEPTAHLDYIQVEGVLRLLRNLAGPGRIVVVATHDERLSPLADRLVEMTPMAGGEERPPERMFFDAGRVIFEQGDRGDLVYVIETGEVEIVRRLSAGGEELLTRLGPGKYFGELAPLFGLQRSATARATAPTTLIGFTIRTFRERMGPDRTADLLKKGV